MNKRSFLGRADLLAGLQLYGESQLDALAAALGYELRAEQPHQTHAALSHVPLFIQREQFTKQAKLQGEQPTAQVTVKDRQFTVPTAAKDEQVTEQSAAQGEPLTPQASVQSATGEPHTKYLRVCAQRRLAPEDSVHEEPGWYRQAAPFSADDPALRPPPGAMPPPYTPLMPWTRLWPWLKRALGAVHTSRRPDLPKVVARLAHGETLRCLPYAKRRGWAGAAQLVLDFAEPLTPFWADFQQLRARLTQMRGASGLQVWVLPDGDPGAPCRLETPRGFSKTAYYRPPSPGAPVLLLSDLGCNDVTDYRRRLWRHYGANLARAGCRAVALMPSPPRCWDAAVVRWFAPVCWDRHIHPPRHWQQTACWWASGSLSPGDEPRKNPTGDHTACSAAERLLTLLAGAVRIEPGLLRDVRYLFPSLTMDVGAEAAAWNHADIRTTPHAVYFDPSAVAVYRQQFRDDVGLTPAQRQAVAALIQRHHLALSPIIRHEESLILAQLLGQAPPQEAQEFAERLSKTLGEKAGAVAQAARHWVGRMDRRQHPSVWGNDVLAAAWCMAHADALQAHGPVDLPVGLSWERLAWTLELGRSRKARRLYRQGMFLMFVDAQDRIDGSPLSPVLPTGGSVQWQDLDDHEQPARLYPIDAPLPIPAERLLLRSGEVELELEQIACPAWASALGQDKYGLYADLTLDSVVQRFRWIAPGSFLMGSPVTEAGRYKDETQHEVTLSRGYWLADSACTQALWRAVLGENPSRFQDDVNNPVEAVSWNGVQEFIAKLNTRLPDLHARLPSEAEWEYACRAGTTTPFSFGDNIMPKQVNYNGDHPYVGGVKGLYRKKTVPVKSLPPNPWGLYEMHGNVWEWCQDWFGDYLGDAVTVPVDSEPDAGCVLRGGSWINYGKFARSSLRYGYSPADYNDFIGFRLALS